MFWRWAGEVRAFTLNHGKTPVPFAESYRIIDFTLSTASTHGIRRIFILTQYKALELTRISREVGISSPAN